MLFRGWHRYLFNYLFFFFFASWQLGKVFRGVYTGNLFPLIRHVLRWIQGLLEKGGGGGGGELIHWFSCVPACSAHSLSPSLSLSNSLPPLFLETSHSRESGPSCSQRLGLASSCFLLLAARVSAVYDIKRRRGEEGGRKRRETCMLCDLFSFLF